MGRKKILEKRLQRLLTKKQSLSERCSASQDAAEVRQLTDQLGDLNAEIEETQAEIDAISGEEQPDSRSAAPAAVPAGTQLVNGGIAASFRAASETTAGAAEQREDVPLLESMEYRKAFMAYAQRGTDIPAELRAGNAISTADTGVMIPMTVMNEVINTIRKRYGNLYAKVRKTSVAGGVKFPIGALQASFKWISEGTVSPRQKLDKLASVTFEYNIAEIRISQTFLASLLTLSAFEAKLTEIIALAYVKAMDYGIMKGSGDGQMLGILNDPRVINTVTMTAANMSDWTEWRKKFFAKLPLGYRAGEFVFSASTVDSYLETMADSNNNPIFKQAAGLEVDVNNQNGRFFGREISLVEEDIIADFDTASAGDVIGLFWQPEEYVINENFGFSLRRYFGEETNEWVDKALTVVDGKVLNPTGFYKILKG